MSILAFFFLSTSPLLGKYSAVEAVGLSVFDSADDPLGKEQQRATTLDEQLNRRVPADVLRLLVEQFGSSWLDAPGPPEPPAGARGIFTVGEKDHGAASCTADGNKSSSEVVTPPTSAARQIQRPQRRSHEIAPAQGVDNVVLPAVFTITWYDVFTEAYHRKSSHPHFVSEEELRFFCSVKITPQEGESEDDAFILQLEEDPFARVEDEVGGTGRVILGGENFSTEPQSDPPPPGQKEHSSRPPRAVVRWVVDSAIHNAVKRKTVLVEGTAAQIVNLSDHVGRLETVFPLRDRSSHSTAHSATDLPTRTDSKNPVPRSSVDAEQGSSRASSSSNESGGEHAALNTAHDAIVHRPAKGRTQTQPLLPVTPGAAARAPRRVMSLPGVVSRARNGEQSASPASPERPADKEEDVVVHGDEPAAVRPLPRGRGGVQGRPPAAHVKKRFEHPDPLQRGRCVVWMPHWGAAHYSKLIVVPADAEEVPPEHRTARRASDKVEAPSPPLSAERRTHHGHADASKKKPATLPVQPPTPVLQQEAHDPQSPSTTTAAILRASLVSPPPTSPRPNRSSTPARGPVPSSELIAVALPTCADGWCGLHAAWGNFDPELERTVLPDPGSELQQTIGQARALWRGKGACGGSSNSETGEGLGPSHGGVVSTTSNGVSTMMSHGAVAFTASTSDQTTRAARLRTALESVVYSFFERAIVTGTGQKPIPAEHDLEQWVSGGWSRDAFEMLGGEEIVGFFLDNVPKGWAFYRTREEGKEAGLNLRREIRERRVREMPAFRTTPLAGSNGLVVRGTVASLLCCNKVKHSTHGTAP